MKKLVLSVLVLLAAVGVRGEQISVEQAMNNACDFVSNGAARMPARVASAAPQLAYTATQDGVNAFYVFNFGDKGYVIAAADDCAAPVLGYSDAGAFDPQAMPDNMRDFLEAYQAEIAAAVAADAPAGTTVPCEAPQRHNIEPLLGTVWSQGEPFNTLCPMDGDYQCVVGCVATAMSQIMYYYKYPAQGTGSNTYTTTIGDEDVTLSLDFSSLTFDWENILPSYRWNVDYTDAQAAAVAQLCYAAGVSVNMMYGPSSTGGSGAYSLDVSRALCNYFGYNRSMHHLMRYEYSPAEWEEIIYNELAAARPVFYHGRSVAGGHAFVCDGYQDGGYFHMNWGWSGMSDGYFRLSALQPDAMGIGGSGSAFNMEQGAIVNINPTDTSEDYYFDIISFNSFDVSGDVTISSENSVSFLLGNMWFTSTYNGSCDMSLGLHVVGQDVEYDDYINIGSYSLGSVSTSYNFGYQNVASTAFEGLADGTYMLYPAYKNHTLGIEGQTTPLYGLRPALKMVKSEGELVFYNVDYTYYSLNTDAMTFTTPLYSGRDFRLEATITNNSVDFDATVHPLLMNAEGTSLLRVWDGSEVNLKSGETGTFAFVGNLSGVDTGDYMLVLAYPLGTYYYFVSTKSKITITEDPGTAPAFTLNGATVNGVPLGEATITSSGINVILSLECTAGYYSDELIGSIYRYDDETGKFKLDKYDYLPYTWASEGQTFELTYFAEFTVDPGREYRLIAQYYNDGWKGAKNSIAFTVVDPAGVADATADGFDVTVVADAIHVAAPGDITALSLYNAAGIAVREVATCGSTADIATDSLPAGIYIVSVSTASATHTTRIALH